jgi:ribonuclease III
VPILDHIDPRTLGKDSKTLLQEYLQGHKIALPTYTVVATHGAAHNQQFEVECTVPKLDVKVSGSGASRRAAEQAAAKKALDEVMAAAPALVAKPRRSKGARAPKAELEVVPGVTGVQGALDLRAPERRARGERPTTVAGAAAAGAAAASAEAPLAVIRAAHVQDKVAEKATDKADRFDAVPSAASIAPRVSRNRETQHGAQDDKTSSGTAETSADLGAAVPVRAADAGH